MTDREALRRKIADEEARLTQVEKERTEALARLQELKGQLAAEDSASTLLTPVPPHNLPLLHKIPHTAEEKVALFRSLFRGREDVFPKLWENAKTGRKGYAPACSNEWVGGVCRKPRIKCGSCSHRSFIPNTDQVVVDHLQGRHVIGVYPLLPDETCFFLAADFDGPSWREDVAAFVETCRRTDRVIGIPSPFFEDEQESKPWTRTPSRKPAEVPIEGLLPKEVHAVLSQRLFVQKAGLPSPLVNRIKRLAAFQNPEFYKKQKMRLSTATTPRVISCAEDLTDHVALPRGCRDDLADLLSGYGINLSMEEKRYEGEPVAFRFQGRLTAMQAEAAKALLSHDDGIFVAPPGSGKTVVGAYLTAARGRNTLVLVHRKPILDQWVARLSSFLGVEPKSIGRIGGGKNSPNGRIDVAMIQSLVRKGKVADLVAGYGHVIVDECHHLPAVSFERVFSEVSAWNVIGLTATPYRRDGHQPIIHMQLGPVRFAFSRHRSAEERTFERRL
ncbi:MAG: DEAD/DEAH box helicase family protein, partial [Deltaproteobacteria bacterium]|nr:DEAD/DEAH box helicase family protein [Deltaproteobacteria bacterium]